MQRLAKRMLQERARSIPGAQEPEQGPARRRQSGLKLECECNAYMQGVAGNLAALREACAALQNGGSTWPSSSVPAVSWIRWRSRIGRGRGSSAPKARLACGLSIDRAGRHRWRRCGGAGLASRRRPAGDGPQTCLLDDRPFAYRSAEPAGQASGSAGLQRHRQSAKKSRTGPIAGPNGCRAISPAAGAGDRHAQWCPEPG